MSAVEFRDPWFLAVALLAPVVLWLSARRASELSYSSLALADAAARTLRARLSFMPAALHALAIVVLAVALAGPRTGDAQTRVQREGIAIVMVADRSGSMNARDMVDGDVSVNRLSIVKDVFKSFVLGDRELGTAGRPDDMIGLVTFARFADSLCPLTLDHGNLATIVEDLEIAERDEDGTAIGDGLGLAVERLRKSRARSRVVILLTDGVSNAGVIEPSSAAGLAADLGIKVYAIGIGTSGLAPFPAADPFTGRMRLVQMRVEIDEKTLRGMAERTGGRYFRATDSQSLAQIYAEIDRMERTEITEMRYLQYTEHYGNWVLAGLGLMVLAAVAGGTLFRRLP